MRGVELRGRAWVILLDNAWHPQKKCLEVFGIPWITNAIHKSNKFQFTKKLVILHTEIMTLFCGLFFLVKKHHNNSTFREKRFFFK